VAYLKQRTQSCEEKALLESPATGTKIGHLADVKIAAYCVELFLVKEVVAPLTVIELSC